MLIRTAPPEDRPPILPVFAAVTAEGSTYAHPVGLPSEEARELWTGQGHVVVAVEDDAAAGAPAPGLAVLGTTVLQPNRPGRGSRVASGSFRVGEQARGRGVGRALGEHLLRRATAEGFRAVQLDAVVETSTPAVALRSLGFPVVGTVPEASTTLRPGCVGLHVMHRFLP